MGKAMSRVDIPAGRRQRLHGLDYNTDDMLFAAIRLVLCSAPSWFQLMLLRPEATGVKKVIELEDSVVVVADNTGARKKPRQWPPV